VATAIVVVAACLDPSPFVVSPRDSSVETSSDETAACLRCLHASDQPGPGCAEEVERCQANPSCANLLVCARVQGCFRGAPQAAILQRGLPCISEAGIAFSDDPALDIAEAVFACLVSSCAPACVTE
jgi:hypothetical protein